MSRFQRILVDVDTTAAVHPELERAVRLAERCGASLTVVDSTTETASTSGDPRAALDDDLVSARRQALAGVAARAQGVRTSSRVLVGRSATSLIQEVQRSGHDLLVRSQARDRSAGDSDRGNVNLELVKKCPCPVLLIGPGWAPPHPRIAGAVDGGSDDVLSGKVIELTLRMSRLEHGAALLLQTWRPFAEAMIRVHAPEHGFAHYVDSARDRLSANLARMARAGDRDHGIFAITRRGEPQNVIPEFVVREGIDLVVMGITPWAEGFKDLFFTSRTERLLRRLTCSLLAVKPDGFVSPVRVFD
jgi:universal stress protein E